MSLFDDNPPLFIEPTRLPSRPREGKPPMEPWLIKHLQETGDMDTSQLGMPAIREARTTYCPMCHHPIKRGLLEKPTPWPVDADITPLSPEGEVLALLDGRLTYSLSWRYGHYVMDRRDAWALRHEPAASLVLKDILVEHRCREPANWPRLPSKLPPPKPKVAELPPDAPPPF